MIAGDTVQLACGGVVMVIHNVIGDEAICHWISLDGKPMTGQYAVLSLRIVQSPLLGGGRYIAFTAQNKDSQAALAGMVVAPHPSGTGVLLASAFDTSKPAIGLIQTGVAPTFAGTVQTNGLMTLTNWTTITGTPALQALATYFLDPFNPGKLTVTPPTSQGQILQSIGAAVAPDTLDIVIGSPILL